MKKRHITLFIVLLIAAVLLLAAATVIYFKLPQENKPFVTKKSYPAPTETTSASADSTAPALGTEPSVSVVASEEPAAPDATEAQPATQAPLTAPDSMTQILSRGGASLESLSALGCSQLVTVSSSGSSAEFGYYYLQDNQWVRDESLTCSGFVGSNGVTADMHEGGRATPIGLYSVGDAFYIGDKPETGLNIFQITEDTYWVDDPNSKYYNQRVEETSDKDWNSAEHMIEYSFQYHYGFVIGYNLSQEYNKGSAIFFHVAANSTAGCIGTDEANVLKYLAKLDASQNPYIMIV